MRYHTGIGAVILALAVSHAAQGEGMGDDWAYHGATGPAHWATLNSGFGLCGTGTQQSPIDIGAAFNTHLDPPVPDWSAKGWQVENAGTGLVAFNEDGGHITLDDHNYTLIQINFHTPSEHALDGQFFPMEAQFMHRDADGHFLILSVMIRGGGRNDALNAILAALPDAPGQAKPLAKIDLASLITDLSDSYRYQGSLTMPPCAETVSWIVLADPLVVGDEALLALESAFPENRRPIQPLNRRIVLTD